MTTQPSDTDSGIPPNAVEVAQKSVNQRLRNVADESELRRQLEEQDEELGKAKKKLEEANKKLEEEKKKLEEEKKKLEEEKKKREDAEEKLERMREHLELIRNGSIKPDTPFITRGVEQRSICPSEQAGAYPEAAASEHFAASAPMPEQTTSATSTQIVNPLAGQFSYDAQQAIWFRAGCGVQKPVPLQLQERTSPRGGTEGTLGPISVCTQGNWNASEGGHRATNIDESSTGTNDALCTICNSALRLLPTASLQCSHVFHSSCAMQLCLNLQACPTCGQYAPAPGNYRP